MNTKPGPEIFISYSRKDSESVNTIINRLQKDGISSSSFFFDQDNIDGAGVFPTVIANAIKECKLLIFFVSKTSSESTWVKNEVFYALKNNKAVLPIFLEHVELEGELDISLSRIQQINIYEGEKEKRIKAILGSLVALGVTIKNNHTQEDLTQQAAESSLIGFFWKKKYFIFITLMVAVLVSGYFIFWPNLFNNDLSISDLPLNKEAPSENIEQADIDRNDSISKNAEPDNTLVSGDSLSLYYSFHIKQQNNLIEIFDGDIVHSGDKMQIRAKVSKDSYLYILNQDAGNNIYVLFPFEGASNLLTSNRQVVIPAENKYVEADSQIGSG